MAPGLSNKSKSSLKAELSTLAPGLSNKLKSSLKAELSTLESYRRLTQAQLSMAEPARWASGSSIKQPESHSRPGGTVTQPGVCLDCRLVPAENVEDQNYDRRDKQQMNGSAPGTRQSEEQPKE
jgi:hypothetical protein